MAAFQFGMPLQTLAQQAPDGLPHIKSDWQAQWIYRVGDPVGNLWIAYRKTFDLNDVPATALASIAADSKYWLWINGEMAVREGGLKRGPTPEDTYYDEVDIAPFLQQGENTVAVLLWYWGKSGYSHLSSGRGGLLFEANIGGLQLVSDRSWKVRRHPSFFNSGPPVPNFRLPETNVVFRAQNDLGSWTQPGYNDAGWFDALVVGQGGGPPWNRLFLRPIPLWRDSGLVDYENSGFYPEVATGDTLIGVLPYNAQVTPYLRIDAPAGLTIDIRTDQYSIKSLDRVNVLNTIRAEYITKEGVQEFEPPAWMNGQAVRYHIPAGVRILDLKYRESGFDTDFVGSFDSSDPFLNRLWTKARRTVYVTMRDYFMETAGRERKQAQADGTIAMLSALYSMDARAKTLMRKFWLEFNAWRTAEGAYLSGVPGNWDPEQPQPNLYAYGDLGFWNYFLLTGDRELLEIVYPSVRTYLFLWELDASGLVVHRSGDWDWFDWESNIDEPVIENAWYYMTLKAAIKMARETGNAQDVQEYERRMESIFVAFNRDFWDGTFYRSPSHRGGPDDRGNGLAVLAGLNAPVDNNDLNRVLRSARHSSPYMENFVLQALFELGDDDGAIARMRDRYFSMVDDPSSTLREFWEPGVASMEHPFATGTLRLLSAYVAGIRPLTPGFERARIEPLLGPLTWVSAEVPTPHGTISSWVQEFEAGSVADPRVKMLVNIPDGVTGLVGIPKPMASLSRVESGGQIVWEDGRIPETVEGIRAIQETSTHVRFEASAGEWQFTLFVKPAPARFDSVNADFYNDVLFLRWSTTEEVDSIGFIVEERISEEFTQIGYVDGSGAGSDYVHQIDTPTAGSHRFRIKAIGRDGAISYSTEMILDIPLETEIMASYVYPNPTELSSTVVLAVASPQQVRAEIVNVLGQRVAIVFDDYLEPGEQYRIRIPVDDLPSGSYAILFSGSGRVARQFIVAR